MQETYPQYLCQQRILINKNDFYTTLAEGANNYTIIGAKIIIIKKKPAPLCVFLRWWNFSFYILVSRGILSNAVSEQDVDLL